MSNISSLFHALIPDYPAWLVAYIWVAFFGAGLIKGFLGMGFPAVLIIMLTLFLPPLEAIPLIIIPMLIINIVQFGRAHQPMAIAKRYGVFAVFMLVTIVVVASFIKDLPEAMLLASIGMAMIIFALNTLFGVPVRIGPHPGWQMAAGVSAGILGGLSAVWSPPVVMYLVGRGVEKEEFIGGVGYIFLIGCIGLLLALGTIELLSVDIALQSLVGLGIALASFRIGEYCRRFIDTDTFRKFLMAAFLIMGSRLVVVSLI